MHSRRKKTKLTRLFGFIFMILYEEIIYYLVLYEIEDLQKC